MCVCVHNYAGQFLTCKSHENNINVCNVMTSVSPANLNVALFLDNRKGDQYEVLCDVSAC